MSSILSEIGTICLSKAGLAIGNGDGAALDIAAPNGAGVDYAIKGILYHKADGTDNAVTEAAEQAALTSCIYLATLDSDGTLVTVKGTEVLTADVTSNKKTLPFPQPADGYCPIGAVRVDCDEGYTFTAGTTAFSADGITDTYYDLMTIPFDLVS